MQPGAKHAYAVTPSDSVNLTAPCRALYVGGAGNIKIELSGDLAGTFVILNGVTAGTTLDFKIRKVYATSTTATNMVALY